MVYNTKTFEILHSLTENGEQHYREMLESKANECLFRSKHPFKYWFNRIFNLIFKFNSHWDGIPTKHDEKTDGFSYNIEK